MQILILAEFIKYFKINYIKCKFYDFWLVDLYVKN